MELEIILFIIVSSILVILAIVFKSIWFIVVLVILGLMLFYKYTLKNKPPDIDLDSNLNSFSYSDLNSNEVQRIVAETWEDQLDLDAHIYADYKKCESMGGQWDPRSSTCLWTKSLCEQKRKKFESLMKRIFNNENVKDEEWNDAFYTFWHEKEKSCIAIPFIDYLFSTFINEKEGEIYLDQKTLRMICTKRDQVGKCTEMKMLQPPCIRIDRSYCDRKKLDYTTRSCGHCIKPLIDIPLEMIFGTTFARLSRERFNTMIDKCKDNPGDKDCTLSFFKLQNVVVEMGFKTSEIESARLIDDVQTKCKSPSNTEELGACTHSIILLNPTYYGTHFVNNYINGIANALGAPNINQEFVNILKEGSHGVDVAVAWFGRNGSKVVKAIGTSPFLRTLSTTGTGIATVFKNIDDKDAFIDFLKSFNDSPEFIRMLSSIPTVNTFMSDHYKEINAVGGALKEFGKTLAGSVGNLFT